MDAPRDLERGLEFALWASPSAFCGILLPRAPPHRARAALKPLLAAFALAAPVVTWFVLQSEEQGTSPEVPALTNDARAADGHAAELVAPLRTEATPVAARVEALIENTEPAPTSVSDGAAAPARNTATLTVRVVDEDGAGVHRANVVLQPTPEEIPALRTGHGNSYMMVQGTTERDGRVTLAVSAGRPLELHGARHGETSTGIVFVASLAVGERAEATIAVKTRADLELIGRVIDAESGAPLPGIELRVQPLRDLSDSPEERPRPLPQTSTPDGVTDAAGQFRLPTKSWSTSAALFTGAGWSPRIARLHQAHPPDATGAAARAGTRTTAEVEVALSRGARIEGVVTGAPGPASVRVMLHGYGLLESEELVDTADWRFGVYGTQYQLSAPVDTGGSFVLEDVPAETELTVALIANATHAVLFQEAQLTRIAHGATQRIAWNLGSGGRFECSVQLASGAPAPDEELWLLMYGPAWPGETEADWEPLRRTRTDSSGRAVFTDVQPGRWVVALAPASEGSREATLRYAVLATMDAAGASAPVEFTLLAPLYISGTILAPDGTPTSAQLDAYSASFNVHTRELGAKGGRFRVGPLVPGRYRLVASRSSPTSEGGPPVTSSDPVLAEAGAVDVALRLNAGCDFVLSAIDAGTGAPAPATFSVIHQESEVRVSTGGYRATATIGGQPPGPYRVLARSEAGLAGVIAVEVAAGERRAVAIPLVAGGSVRVAYGGPAQVLFVELEDTGATVGFAYVPSGGIETLHAPAGSYTLRLAVREFDHTSQSLKTLREETRTITITAGAELRIDHERS